MPLAEIFSISGLEMLLPTDDDFIFLFPNDFNDIADIALCQTGIHGKFNLGLDPELPFALGCRCVTVHTCFLTGEEVEPIALMPEDRWAHARIL
jgi:hypothetical protein